MISLKSTSTCHGRPILSTQFLRWKWCTWHGGEGEFFAVKCWSSRSLTTIASWPLFAVEELPQDLQREGSFVRVCEAAEKHERDLQNCKAEIKTEINVCGWKKLRRLYKSASIAQKESAAVPVTAELLRSAVWKTIQSTLHSFDTSGLAILAYLHTTPGDIEDILHRFHDMKPRRIVL